MCYGQHTKTSPMLQKVDINTVQVKRVPVSNIVSNNLESLAGL